MIRDWKTYVRRRLVLSGLRPDREAEIAEDLARQLDDAECEALQRGATPNQARAIAERHVPDWKALSRELNSTARGKEMIMERWQHDFEDSRASKDGFSPLIDLRQDVMYGLRVLRRAPGFAAIAILTLAIGIGANTAMFSLVSAALLRPLPFQNPDAIFLVWEKPPKLQQNSVAPLNYLDWKAQSTSFGNMAATEIQTRSMTLTGTESPEALRGKRVSASFFDLLGVAPAAGRFFAKGEEQPANSRVAVISYALWQRRFAANREIIGGPIALDGAAYTVIGVAPAELEVLGAADLWIPFEQPRDTATRSSHFLRVFARLKPGVSLPAARAEMNGIASQIAKASPQTNRDWSVFIQPLHEYLIGPDLRTTSLVLMAAVGFVLLIACANVANLLLVRGEGRSPEICLRRAVGAGAGRIARQLLTESVLLAVVGGGLGLMIAQTATETAHDWLPAGTIPAWLTPRLDFRVTLFALCATLLTGLACGLAPALHAQKSNLVEVLRTTGSMGGSRRGNMMRQVLATVEIALAFVLAVGAGLLLRTIVSLDSVDPGYRAEQVLTFHVSLPGQRYRNPSQVITFYQSVMAAVQRLSGVRAAAFATDLPLEGMTFGTPFERVDRAPEPATDRVYAHYQVISPSYFKTLGIPLLHGREFEDRDTATGAPSVIINHAVAQRFFPEEDPIGRRLRFSGNNSDKITEWEIVGVTGQVKTQAPGERNVLELYVPYTQDPPFGASFAILAGQLPERLTSSVRIAIKEVDPQLPLTAFGTLEDIAAKSVSRPRVRSWLLGTFAAIALFLAAIGIYGVLAYSVGCRTREFGVRMALGAKRGDVLNLVLRNGLLVSVLGIAFGILAAVGLTRYLTGMLYGVMPLDPMTFGGVAVLMSIVALAACCIPAYRATRVNPIVALRFE